MKKLYVLVVWIVNDEGETEFRSFVTYSKEVAKRNARALDDTLGKCKTVVKLYDVEIVEVEI